MYTDTSLGPIENFKEVVFENYANFSGRARRSEFWMFMVVEKLILLLIFSLFCALDMILGEEFTEVRGMYAGGVILLYTLGLLLPKIAVTVRRLHDTGHSGFCYFLFYIPFGVCILFYLFVKDSDFEENDYGPSPKYGEFLIE